MQTPQPAASSPWSRQGPEVPVCGISRSCCTAPTVSNVWISTIHNPNRMDSGERVGRIYIFGGGGEEVEILPVTLSPLPPYRRRFKFVHHPFPDLQEIFSTWTENNDTKECECALAARYMPHGCMTGGASLHSSTPPVECEYNSACSQLLYSSKS